MQPNAMEIGKSLDEANQLYKSHSDLIEKLRVKNTLFAIQISQHIKCFCFLFFFTTNKVNKTKCSFTFEQIRNIKLSTTVKTLL